MLLLPPPPSNSNFLNSNSMAAVLTTPFSTTTTTTSATSALHENLLHRKQQQQQQQREEEEEEVALDASRGRMCDMPHDVERSRAWKARATKRTVQATTILVACGACMKTTSYAASNWMPELNVGYWSYALGNVVGTVISAVVVGTVDVVVVARGRSSRDRGRRRGSSNSGIDNDGGSGDGGGDGDCDSSVVTIVVALAASTSLLCLALTGCAWVPLWSVGEFALAFGIVSAFVSTTLSVCMCVTIGDECGRYGRTTAHADGGATLIAAALQPCARLYFVRTQVGATAALVLVLALMLLVELEHERTLVGNRP